MAYNEIQVGRFLRAFQKYFSMKGYEPKEITLAPEIMPVIGLDWHTDTLFHQGWQRWARADTVAAVVGQNSAVKLRNPVGSNVIAIVELMGCDETAADTFRAEMLADTTDFPTISNGASLDPRQQSVAPNCICSKGNNVISTVHQRQRQALANTHTEMILPEDDWPLLPGQSIILSTLTANVVLQFELQWRERFLEESERT